MHRRTVGSGGARIFGAIGEELSVLSNDGTTEQVTQWDSYHKYHATQKDNNSLHIRKT